jgi:oligoribonuclease
MNPLLPLRLVWVDLEMTGLNPKHDTILEIAAVVTGADLVPLAEIERVVHQPDENLALMSARVRQIHTDNGLLEDVKNKGMEIRIAEHNVLQAISKVTEPGQALLCGRSVDHDWKFLLKHMPRLEQHLHTNRVDVATMSVLVDNWFPDLMYQPPTTRHRAMEDVKAGLDEMRYYCKNAFHVKF